MKSKANRFLRSSCLFGLLTTTIVVHLGTSNDASAASQNWTGATDANWATGTNWSGGAAPGVLNPANNNTGTGDSATFNAALNGTIGSAANPITNDAGRMIAGLFFDTANVGAYTIGTTGGNALLMRSGNSVTINAAVTNAQVMNTPITVRQNSSTNGTFSFVNNSTTTAATLTLGGAINAAGNGRPSTTTLTGTNTGNNLISGALSNPSATQSVPLLVKSGAGTWILSGANTFNGTSATAANTANGIQINAGLLVVENNAALGTNGTANANVNNYINSGGTLELNSSSANGSITLDNGLILTLNSGGTIRSNGTNATSGRIALSTAAATTATISTVNSNDVFTIGNGSNDFSGGASDTVTRFSGPGTILLSQASNYAGTVSVDAGTLQIGSPTALGSTSTAGVAFGSSSTGKLQVNGNSITVVNLNSNATPGTPVVENGVAGTSTLTVNNASANTFAGVLQNGAAGTLSLTKGAAGPLTLSGANTYTGATTINAGTLNVIGSLASGSSVAANLNGTLAGNGSVAGTVTVATNGHIAPGNAGIGTLTVGSLTLATGSQLDYDITNTSTLDQITVSNSGGLTINGGQLNINGGTGLFTANGVYNLIGYSGALGGSTTNLSVNLSNKDTTNKDYTFGSNGSFVTLTIANAAVVANFWNADANGNWSTGGNWTVGTPNAVGAFAAFGGGGTEITANRTIAVNALFTVGTISFNGAANNKAYTLSDGGGSLTLDNGATGAFLTNTASSNSIASSVILTSNGITTTVSSAADTLTVYGVVSGTGAMTKVGAGTLALSGANTFVGNTTINAGKVQINSLNSFGDAANTVTINAATLQSTENITTTRNITLGDVASVISVDAAKTYSVGGVVSGGGALNKSGSGTLTLTGTNTFSGGAAINAGTLAINTDSSLGNAANSVTINAGTLQTTANITAARALTLGNAASTISTDTGTTYTVSGVVGGSGVLNKAGSGTLTLTGATNSIASTVITSGTIALGGGNGNFNNALGNGSVTFQNGTLSSNSLGVDIGGGGVGFANNFIVASGMTGTLNLSFRGVVSGSLTGAGTFNVNVAGTRDDFSGNWSAFTGQLNIGNGVTGGDFRINNTNGFGTAKLNLAAGVNMSVLFNFNPTLTISAGEINGAATSFLGGGTVGGRTLTWSVGAIDTDSVFNGTIRDGGTSGQNTGPTAITKVGSRKWTIAGSNTYTGITTVSAGTLQIGNGGTSGSLGSGGTVTNNAALVFNRSDAATVSNVINGIGTLAQNGSGTLTLASIGNGYTGGTAINGGTLNINSVWQLGGGVYGGLTFGATGGTLQYASTLLNSATDITQDTSDGGLGVNGVAKNVTLTGNAIIDTNGNDVNYKNTFGNSGAGSLTKIGNGTLTLAGTSTYTSATTVNGGTLSVTGSTAALSAVTVGPSGTLAGTGTVNGTVAGAGTIAPGVGGIGILTTGAATLSGTALAIEVNGGSADKLVSTGIINLSGGAVGVSVLGTLTGPVIIAEGTSVTGTLPSVTSGYQLTIVGGTQLQLSVAASGYSTWSTTGFATNVGAADVDYDTDGVINGVEYIFGGSPISGSDNAKIYSLIADTDADTLNELVMTIAVPQGTPVFPAGSPSSSVTFDGFTIEVRGSTDLSSFATTVTPVTPVTTGLPAAPFVKGGITYEYRSFSLDGSNGTPTKGFLQALIR